MLQISLSSVHNDNKYNFDSHASPFMLSSNTEININARLQKLVDKLYEVQKEHDMKRKMKRDVQDLLIRDHSNKIVFNKLARLNRRWNQYYDFIGVR
tara:strand:+ start:1614 stop:1904 length:291 start_codon:yes stop_codon:yes gene_type:complete